MNEEVLEIKEALIRIRQICQEAPDVAPDLGEIERLSNNALSMLDRLK